MRLPWQWGAKSRDKTSTGIRGDTHVLPPAAGVSCFSGEKSLLPQDKRKELVLHEFSGFVANRGSQNILSQI